MGSPTTEAGRSGDETQHQVTLTNGFYLGKYEVTQAQYETVMTGNSEGLNADPSNNGQKGNNRPVDTVSWNDVQVFLSRLNDMEQTAGRLPAGWKYVLPTEAQWEYASRAGTTTAYSWGNDINSSLANYNWDGGSNDGNDFKQTRDVGQYAANPWGFLTCREMCWSGSATGRRTILPVLKPIPRVQHRARFGSTGVVPGTTAGRSCVQLGVNDGTPGNRSSIGFRVGFQPVQPDTANPELELFGNSVITHSQGGPLGGARRRGPRCSGRKYHRSDRDHGNGGYE